MVISSTLWVPLSMYSTKKLFWVSEHIKSKFAFSKFGNCGSNCVSNTWLILLIAGFTSNSSSSIKKPSIVKS